MLTSIKTIIAFCVAMLCPAAAPGQQSQTLFNGLNQERTLTHGEDHVYQINLETGAAVIGEANQRGIDLVIDVIGPGGQKIRTFDSPNGTEGSERIDFTALQSGTYKFIVHTLANNRTAGRYVIKVNQLITAEDNAKRLAKQSLPNPALYDLWEASVGDPKAVDRFLAKRKGRDPILEAVPINDSEMRVTYVVAGDQDTERVLMGGGPDFFGIYLRRLGKTNLFFGTQTVPNDSRFVYAFNLFKTHRAGAHGEVEVQEVIHSDDYLLEMPNAPPQPYIVAKDRVAKGKTARTTITSAYLSEERNLTVYTPAGYDGTTPCNLDRKSVV